MDDTPLSPFYNRPRRNIRLSIISFGIIMLAVLLYIGIYSLLFPTESKVLSEAAAWRKSQTSLSCTTAMTPAIHTETGVKHTFSDGCLPPGWVYDYQ